LLEKGFQDFFDQMGEKDVLKEELFTADLYRSIIAEERDFC